jgi:hypothetical protein
MKPAVFVRNRGGAVVPVISASNPAYTGHWLRPNIAVGKLADLNGVPLPCTGGGRGGLRRVLGRRTPQLPAATAEHMFERR